MKAIVFVLVFLAIVLSSSCTTGPLCKDPTDNSRYCQCQRGDLHGWDCDTRMRDFGGGGGRGR